MSSRTFWNLVALLLAVVVVLLIGAAFAGGLT